jgi:tetratricopeptide (TPR) repeat protein
VVAAMLANLAETPEPEAATAARPEAPSPRTELAAMLQAGALVVVAWFLVSAGHRAEQAERFRLAARQVPPDRAIAYLQAALRIAPDRSDLHVALADALMQHAGDNARQRQVLTVLGADPLAGWPALLTAVDVADRLPAMVLPHSALAHAARQHTVLARAHSPLSVDAHERALRLSRRDHATEDALARLRFLEPSNPTPWFLSGQRAFRRGDCDIGLAHWRHALLANDRYLAEVAKAVPRTLSAVELLDEVLAPDASMIVAATKLIAPGSLTPEAKRRYYQKAITLLAVKGAERTADDFLLAARVHDRLEGFAAARDAYLAALALNPRSSGWRLEFCEFLHRTQRDAEARTELLVLLDQEPANRAADRLYQQVLRTIAEHE